MSIQQKQTPNKRDFNHSVEQGFYVICRPKDKETSNGIGFKQVTPGGVQRPRTVLMATHPKRRSAGTTERSATRDAVAICSGVNDRT